MKRTTYALAVFFAAVYICLVWALAPNWTKENKL